MITSKLVQMESNGDHWSKEQVLFSKLWLLTAEHVEFYSWISVTEMVKWSTTGFSLQYQSVMNQTTQDENYSNQVDDVVLMYQQILRALMWREMKDREGELKMVEIWSLFKYMYIYSYTRLEKKLKFRLASRTMSSQILLALGKSWFTNFEFLISGRTTSLDPCPFGKWQWIYLSWTTGQNFF